MLLPFDRAQGFTDLSLNSVRERIRNEVEFYKSPWGLLFVAVVDGKFVGYETREGFVVVCGSSFRNTYRPLLKHKASTRRQRNIARICVLCSRSRICFYDHARGLRRSF